MDMLERLLSVQIIERIGWTLIHFVWQGAAIALLLAVFLRVLHKRSASARYTVACVALGLVVVMPAVTLPFIEVSRPTAEAGLVPTAQPAIETLPVEMVEVTELAVEPVDMPLVEITPPEIHVPWTQRAATMLEPALPYLVLGWLLGVFGLSAWHLGGWAQLQRMRCRMVREVAKPLEATLTQLATQLGVTRVAGLLQSALVEVPTVVGWIKPVILLPASAISGLTADQLEAILAHELAHIRRYDYLVNILQTVVEILGFYHPGLWWISQTIRNEREHCCDDLAVQVTGDSVRYARALTNLEEMRHRGGELAIAAGGGNLLGRIARLLDRPAPRRGRFTWLPGLIALILATLIVIPTAMVLASPTTQTQDRLAEVDLDKAFEGQMTVIDDFESYDDREDTGTTIWQTWIDGIEDSSNGGSISSNPASPFSETKIVRSGRQSMPLHYDPNASPLSMVSEVDRDFSPPQDWTRGDIETLSLWFYGTPGNSGQLYVKINNSKILYDGPESNLAKRKWQVWNIDLLRVEGNLSSVYRFSIGIEKNGPGLLYIDDICLHSSTQAPTVSSVTEMSETDASEQSLPVDIELILAEVKTAKPLNGSMLSSVIDILATQHPDVRDLAKTIDRSQGPTLGQLLRKCAMGKPLTAATVVKLIDPLQSCGYLKIQSKPSVRMLDNTPANISLSKEVPIHPGGDPNGSPTYMKVGTFIEITPHLAPADDLAVVEMEVTWRRLIEEQKPNRPPAIENKEMATQVAVPNDRYFPILMDAKNTGKTAGADEESMLVLFKTRWDDISAEQDDTSAQTAPPKPNPERFVQLQVRIAEIDSEKLNDLLLPWVGSETDSQRYRGPRPTGPFCFSTNDKLGTDRILADLNRLSQQNHAKVMAAPSVTVRDKEESDFSIMNEEHYLIYPDGTEEMVAITSGTKLKATPRIGQNNDITLEVSAEISNVNLVKDPNNLPIVTRRTSRNVTTLQDGGTMALAGMSPPPDSEDEDSTKEIVILITARVLPDEDMPKQQQEGKCISAPIVAAPSNAPKVVTVTFVNEDLKRALAKVSTLSGTIIIPDANVTGQVSASFESVPLETALETLLAGTPYHFKDFGDYYLVMVPETPPRPSSNTKSAAVQVQIQTRFLILSRELVEALQRGTLIEDTNSPEEIAALSTLEKRMTPNEWIGVDETVVSTLLKVAQGDRETHSLAAPRLTVPVDESASLALTDTIFYTSGYDEPNEGSGVPVAREATVSPGLTMEITPSLAPEDQIILNGTTTFTNLKGFEDRTYRDEHVYQVPVLDTDEIAIENVHLADGQAALLLTPSGIQSGPTKESSDSEEAGPLLILIEAKKGFIEGSDTSQMPPMLQHQPLAPTKPLPRGFGGVAPGPLPPVPLPPVPKAAEQD